MLRVYATPMRTVRQFCPLSERQLEAGQRSSLLTLQISRYPTFVATAIRLPYSCRSRRPKYFTSSLRGRPYGELRSSLSAGFLAAGDVSRLESASATKPVRLWHTGNRTDWRPL